MYVVKSSQTTTNIAEVQTVSNSDNRMSQSARTANKLKQSVENLY